MSKNKTYEVFKPQEVKFAQYYPMLGPGRVLVLKDEIEEKTKSGLYLPESVRDEKEEFSTRGTVVMYGKLEKELSVDLPISPGIRVAFGKYAGTEFSWGDQEFFIIRHDEIFACWKIEREIK
jgi:chaperonin GroES